MIRRFLAAAVVALALAGLVPVAAHAQDGFPSTPWDGIFDGIGDVAGAQDCRTPPPVASPTIGAGYSIDPGPDNPRPGSPREPFTENPSTTPYELYGYGGLNLHRYDPGCVLERLPGDVILSQGQMGANWKFGWAAQIVALSVASGELLRDPEPLRNAIDPLVIGTNDLLAGEIYYPMIGLAAVILGIWMLWRAKDADIKHVWRQTGGAALILVAASVFLNYPAWALDKYWEISTTVVNGIDELFSNENAEGADPGVVAAADLHYNALILPYMSALVCSSTGPTFDEHAANLYRFSRFTFSQDRVFRADPGGYGKELTDAKQAQWQQIADEIEQTDPAAYNCLQGELGDVQSQYATASLALAASLGGTQTVANVLLNVSNLFAALLVALFPAIAVIGMVRQGFAWSGFAKVGVWLFKALALFATTRVLTNLAGGMLERGVAPLIVAFIVVALLVAFIFWRVSRNRWVRRAGREAWKYARGRKAVEDGMEARDRDRDPAPDSPPPAAPTITVEQQQPTYAATAREGQPGTHIAGELPPPPSWIDAPQTEPANEEQAADYGVPTFKPRVMEPDEQFPAGVKPTTNHFQTVHRPADRRST